MRAKNTTLSKLNQQRKNIFCYFLKRFERARAISIKTSNVATKLELHSNFRYTLDNGEIFHGRAHKIDIPYYDIHLLIGDKRNIYWAELMSDDLKIEEPFTKPVRSGQISVSFILFIILFQFLFSTERERRNHFYKLN